MAVLQGYENFDDIYKESIKTSVNNGSFFEDGMDFFSTAYLRTITDRSFYIFIAVIASFICYNVFGLITYILPIKEDVFITIKEKDITKYATSIKDISKDKDSDTTDEHILRYLLIDYVKEREEHDYRSGKLSDINDKLSRINSKSSTDVISDFRYFMSRENANGPYYYFGKGINTSIEVSNFRFKRIIRKNFIQKIKDWLFGSLLPIGANIYYNLVTELEDGQIIKEKRRAYIEFNFIGVRKDDKGNYMPVSFLVTQYKNFLAK